MTLRVKIYRRRRLAWFTPAVLQGLAQVLPVLGGKRLSLEIRPMTGIDPLQSLFDSCLPFPPLIEFFARDLILHETPMGLEAGAGVD
jgi:hypothetical protein